MYFKSKKIEITDELLIDIVKCAKEAFGHVIYVPCDNHPCGWDSLDVDLLDEDEEILEYKFEINDISDGIYDWHPLQGKTLREILTENGCKFEFEIY